MLEEQVRKIIELRHDAPHTVLGPHYDERERALLIRAFLPQAERVWVLPADGSPRCAMQRLHADGLFVARLQGITELDYRLLIEEPGGRTRTLTDPYAIHEPSFLPADGEALAAAAAAMKGRKVAGLVGDLAPVEAAFALKQLVEGQGGRVESRTDGARLP